MFKTHRIPSFAIQISEFEYLLKQLFHSQTIEVLQSGCFTHQNNLIYGTFLNRSTNRKRHKGSPTFNNVHFTSHTNMTLK